MLDRLPWRRWRALELRLGVLEAWRGEALAPTPTPDDRVAALEAEVRAIAVRLDTVADDVAQRVTLAVEGKMAQLADERIAAWADGQWEVRLAEWFAGLRAEVHVIGAQGLKWIRRGVIGGLGLLATTLATVFAKGIWEAVGPHVLSLLPWGLR